MGMHTPSSVTPNPKCEGCANYERDSGRTGLCIVGMQPFNCGDGSTPYLGYTPIRHLTPDVPEGNAPTAHAITTGEPVDPDSAIVIVEQVLGAEHGQELAKSVIDQASAIMKDQCPACRLQKSMGYGSASAAAQKMPLCLCRKLKADFVAKSMHGRLPPRQRVRIDLDVLTTFCSELMKGDVSEGEVIGTTRNGHEVKAPDLSNLQKSVMDGVVRARFATAGDHYDAAQLHERAAHRHQVLGHVEVAKAHREHARQHSYEYTRRA